MVTTCIHWGLYEQILYDALKNAEQVKHIEYYIHATRDVWRKPMLLLIRSLQCASGAWHARVISFCLWMIVSHSNESFEVGMLLDYFCDPDTITSKEPDWIYVERVIRHINDKFAARKRMR